MVLVDDNAPDVALVECIRELLLMRQLNMLIHCALIALSRPVGHPLPLAGEGRGERGALNLSSTQLVAASIVPARLKGHKWPKTGVIARV
jgi:hypothetical protein